MTPTTETNMIDPRELRLNNLINVMYHGSYEPMEVVEITDYDLLHVRLGIHRLANPVHVKTDVSPIPLTPEWLKRFVFEDNRGFKSVRIALSPLGKWQCRTFLVVALQIDYTNTEAWLDLITERGNNDYPELQSMTIPCQYVHQLQNLYFSLTGRELELKPEKKQ